MAFAELWLPIIGAGICIAWAIGAWYGGNKILATWLTFGGVVCLLLLGTLQWQHLIEENEPSKVDEAKAISQKQLRAYIFIETGEVIFDGAKSNVILNFKNFGATPAYDLVGWIKTGIRNPADPVILNPMPRPDAEARDSKTTVGPQGTFRLSQNDDLNDFLPKEEVEKLLVRLEKGESLFVVTGDVVYRDAFDRRWELAFECRAIRQGKIWVLQATRDGNSERQLP
jgi:hypothetical protein